MKIFIYSDIQFNPWAEFSTVLPDGRNSRLQDQINVQREIFEKAIECSTTDDVILVHNGDLFESLTEKIDKLTFLSVFEEFEDFSRVGIPVILLLGNHDWIDKTEMNHIVKPLRSLSNVLIVDKPMVEFIENSALCFIPYTKRDFLAKIKDVKSQSKDRNQRYLFTHQGINGAKVGPRDIPLKDEFDPRDFELDYFTLVFNGHYHKPQTFPGGLYVIGSSVQRDFGERNDEKGYWVLDTKEKPKNPTFFKISNAPKFFKIEVEKEKDLHLPDGFTSRDFLWVVSAGVGKEKIDKVLGEFENFNPKNVRVEVVKKAERKVRTSISVSDSVELQIKKYLDYCETDLDKGRLLTMSVDKYKKSIEQQ